MRNLWCKDLFFQTAKAYEPTNLHKVARILCIVMLFVQCERINSKRLESEPVDPTRISIAEIQKIFTDSKKEVIRLNLTESTEGSLKYEIKVCSAKECKQHVLHQAVDYVPPSGLGEQKLYSRECKADQCSSWKRMNNVHVNHIDEKVNHNLENILKLEDDLISNALCLPMGTIDKASEKLSVPPEFISMIYGIGSSELERFRWDRLYRPIFLKYISGNEVQGSAQNDSLNLAGESIPVSVYRQSHSSAFADLVINLLIAADPRADQMSSLLDLKEIYITDNYLIGVVPDSSLCKDGFNCRFLTAAKKVKEAMKTDKRLAYYFWSFKEKLSGTLNRVNGNNYNGNNYRAISDDDERLLYRFFERKEVIGEIAGIYQESFDSQFEIFNELEGRVRGLEPGKRLAVFLEGLDIEPDIYNNQFRLLIADENLINDTANSLLISGKESSKGGNRSLPQGNGAEIRKKLTNGEPLSIKEQVSFINYGGGYLAKKKNVRQIKVMGTEDRAKIGIGVSFQAGNSEGGWKFEPVDPNKAPSPAETARSEWAEHYYHRLLVHKMREVSYVQGVESSLADPDIGDRVVVLGSNHMLTDWNPYLKEFHFQEIHTDVIKTKDKVLADKILSKIKPYTGIESEGLTQGDRAIKVEHATGDANKIQTMFEKYSQFYGEGKYREAILYAYDRLPQEITEISMHSAARSLITVEEINSKISSLKSLASEYGPSELPLWIKNDFLLQSQKTRNSLRSQNEPKGATELPQWVKDDFLSLSLQPKETQKSLRSPDEPKGATELPQLVKDDFHAKKGNKAIGGVAAAGTLLVVGSLAYLVSSRPELDLQMADQCGDTNQISKKMEALESTMRETLKHMSQ